jgi:hypothetical protein
MITLKGYPLITNQLQYSINVPRLSHLVQDFCLKYNMWFKANLEVGREWDYTCIPNQC